MGQPRPRARGRTLAFEMAVGDCRNRRRRCDSAWHLGSPENACEENAVANTTPRTIDRPVNQLTTGTDLNTEPTVSPDGEWVAYASDCSGEGHLDIGSSDSAGVNHCSSPATRPTSANPRFRTMEPASHSIPGAREAASTSSPLTAMARPDFSSPAARMDHGSRRTDAGSRIRWDLAVQQDKGAGALARHLPHPVSWRRVDGIVARLRVGRVADLVSRRRHLLAHRQTRDQRGSEWWIVAPDGQAPVKISGFNLVTDSDFQCDPGAGSRETASSTRRRSGATAGTLWEVVIAPRTWIVTTEPRRLTTAADLQAHASIVRGTQLVFSSFDPDRQCVGRSGPRQQRSGRGFTAKSHGNVRTPVVAFGFGRWPPSGVSKRQTGHWRSLD